MAHRSVVLASALLLASACASSPDVQRCATDAECGDDNLCLDGACVVNAPPVGDFALPTSETSNRLLAIAPVLSDPEGRAVAARWSVQATTGGCAPDVEPRADAGLEVIFWCPGTYEVALVPVDETGLEGSVVVRSIAIAQAVGAPSVTGGATIQTTYACDPYAGTCHVIGPNGESAPPLSAVAADPEGYDVTYKWAALPFEGIAPDTALAVVFLPDDDDEHPHVSIQSALGVSLAGTHRFRVRVCDLTGLVAQAFQEVVVTSP